MVRWRWLGESQLWGLMVKLPGVEACQQQDSETGWQDQANLAVKAAVCQSAGSPVVGGLDINVLFDLLRWTGFH